MTKKALQLASVASMIDQFNIHNIEILQTLGYQVDVVADFTNPGTITNERAEDLKKRLENMGVRVFDSAIPRTLNPLAISNAYKQVKELLKKENYSILHCHSPIGGVIARQVAKRLRKEGLKVIYTAHGFHFYDGAPLKNWLIFYPIEKYYSHYTDVLITINEEDYKRASEKFHAKKTVYVQGVGVDTEKYAHIMVDRIVKRKELGIPPESFLIVSVGELNKNKNHAVVIRAIAEIRDPIIHYAIAGKGGYKEKLLKIAKEQGIEEQVHLLGFRNDVPELYACADLCAFPSIREGQGIAALEGMAAGLPLVASDNRGMRGILVDRKNALICKYDDVSMFSKAIDQLVHDPQLRNKMGVANQKLASKFDVDVINRKMQEIYSSMVVHT